MKLLIICPQICIFPKSSPFFPHHNLCLVKLHKEHSKGQMPCSGRSSNLHSQVIQISGCLLGSQKPALSLSNPQCLCPHHENFMKCLPICGNFEDFNTLTSSNWDCGMWLQNIKKKRNFFGFTHYFPVEFIFPQKSSNRTWSFFESSALHFGTCSLPSNILSNRGNKNGTKRPL